jgi:hypothetical protein
MTGVFIPLLINYYITENEYSVNTAYSQYTVDMCCFSR